MRRNRPKVIINFALTADGKVSTRKGTPSGFTTAEDKRRFREIRALGDAVLVGAKTVEVDNMSMRLSDPKLRAERKKRGQTPEPLRLIVSNRGKLDPNWKVFQPGGAPLFVFSTIKMPEKVRREIAPLCELWVLAEDTVDLESLLHMLRRQLQIKTLVCEGGPRLIRELFALDAIDEIHLTWAGVVFGGKKAPSLTGLPGDFLPKLIRTRLKKMEVGDGECYLTYQVLRPKS